MTDHIKNNAEDHPDYAEKSTIVDEFLHSIKAVSTVPNSLEWVLSRLCSVDANNVSHYTVGGSELPSVMNVNPHQTPEQLCETKAHLIATGEQVKDTRPEAVRMKWGHVVEPLLRRRCGAILGTTFYDVPASLKHPTNKNMRYTPDGVGVIRVQKWNNVIGACGDKDTGRNDNGDNDQLVIVLLELKNPMDRVVKGIIPPYYMPQIMSGMDTVPIVEAGLFVEGNWKIKAFRDLLQPRYNAAVHMMGTINGKTGSERFDNLEILDASVIIIYHTSENPLHKAIDDIDDDSNLEYSNWISGLISNTRSRSALKKLSREGSNASPFVLVDFGDAATTVFTTLMNLLEYYPDMVKSDNIELLSEAEKNEFNYNLDYVDECIIDKCNELTHKGYHPFGIIPIALYKEFFYYLGKETGYVAKQQTAIDSFITKLSNRVASLGGPYWSKEKKKVDKTDYIE